MGRPFAFTQAVIGPSALAKLAHALVVSRAVELVVILEIMAELSDEPFVTRKEVAHASPERQRWVEPNLLLTECEHFGR